MFALLLGFFILVSSRPSVPYDRFIFYSKDIPAPTSPTRVFDPGFNRTLSFACGRLYGPEYPAEIFTLATSWFLKQFGINWALGAPVPGFPGARVLPQGLLFPFINGEDHLLRIHTDVFVDGKERTNTKEDNNWFIFDTGYLVVLSGNGTFPGGVLAGATYLNGQILAYTQYTFLNEDYERRWGTIDPRWREVFTLKSYQPTLSQPNAFGQSEQYISTLVFDECDCDDEIGFAAISVIATRFPDNSTIQSTRGTITFPRQQSYPPIPPPLPCPTPRPF